MRATVKQFAAAALLVCGLAGALSVAAQSVQITDARGAQVQLAKPPQRIVSLLPSLTESLCALGGCERLVGVDRYSNWPAHVKTVPVVGGGLDPNIEAIVALKPDLVLVSMASRAIARMEALGLKVVALEPRTHEEARTVMQKIGQLLALPPTQGADRVWAGIEADLNKAAASVPGAMRGQRVYFEASRGPYAAGEKSFIGQTLTRLHLRNVVDARQGPFPRLNPEYVVKLDPDILMAGERAWKTGVPEYPGWAQMRAVKQGAICAFTPEQSDILVRPGPRMAEGAQIIAQCLQRLAARQGKSP
ncbi:MULTISPECIES: ABC transporter substrate-binding protein [Comamonas]|uniref:ABC transporter substrate-binding protein n=1 Tax=Comamonas thiooxydans TaxID=363952 RepID=A0A0E3BNK5_9BURK|nr:MULTISPECIES: helical backbone metal receptor [Comamonas]KGH04541.1 ABC transporter substrate-binding protein [Comamonas thiooxydans]KGH18582.1 ABC transporter substrate-binding protein [Comamonas thiooxydans]KGH19544.1 ABC transporter substrate-binding protein [Comamonas thiooxydans]CUA92531.1 ABC-type Fe3+-hydroxamate transport system, periplasmic component [Comamonas thiooxydans]GAO71403.1 ABC transporter substrate-binding protein [Comamonas sp. E6]